MVPEILLETLEAQDKRLGLGLRELEQKGEANGRKGRQIWGLVFHNHRKCAGYSYREQWHRVLDLEPGSVRFLSVSANDWYRGIHSRSMTQQKVQMLTEKWGWPKCSTFTNSFPGQHSFLPCTHSDLLPCYSATEVNLCISLHLSSA